MSWAAHMKRYYWLYLFLIPGMVFLLLFKYLPIYGLQIAFKDYSIVRGIEASPWVGLKHFRDLFRSINFTRVLRNSILTSIFRLLWGFPMPILLALMMNEMRAQGYKRVMQSILYLPHFISWVVVISMLTGLLSQSTGVVNMVRKAIGLETIPFMNSRRWFRTVLIGAGIWKECGWGTVVYMAALSGIDPALYEAATIDGANRMQKITHITLPCIMGTVTVMLVMNMGNILSNGFEQIWLLQNALNKEVAEVLETYSYQVGLKEGRYSFATAVGMFQSLVGLIMIFGSNALSKQMGGRRTVVTNKAHHVNQIRLKASDKALMAFNYAFVTLTALLMLYPIINILAVSLSNYYEYLKTPWMIIPKRLNVEAYKYVFRNASFWRSYGNTIIVAGTGTLIGLGLTIVTAYPLSRPMLRLKPLWMTIIIFTMVFNAGMIPNFLNIRNLGMYDSLWALILPGAFGAFNCILMLNFFKEIPASLTEAAEIDGASEPKILFGIVVSLSKSVIATIALFLAVGYWNTYFSAQIYLKSSEKWPIALMLKEILLSASTKALEAANDAAAMDQMEDQLQTTTLQYACIIVSMVPIMCVYPFLQKYFAKGVMLGGVKG